VHSAGDVSVAGVSVAKPGSAESIGVLIPADEVRRALAGHVGALDLTLESINEGTANVQVNAGLVDPKGMVKAVAVHVAPADTGTIVPYSDGTWPPLRNTKGAELQHDPNTMSASGRMQIAISDSDAAARRVLIQTAHQYQSGQLVYSRPRAYDLPGKPGRIYPTGAPLELILSGARRASFALLGPLVDPESDCNLEKDAKSQTIKIGVPCDKPHTLAPELVTERDKKNPLHNAPMTLTPVEGDFAAIVRVTADLSPGLTLPEDRQGNNISSTFQGAGLLLYQDKNNFVRLERTAAVPVGSIQPVHKVLLEVVKGGKPVESQKFAVPSGGPVYLILLRQSARVTCRASVDLTGPAIAVKSFEFKLPSKVNVGLSVSNISASPFTATFEKFALLNDLTILESR